MEDDTCITNTVLEPSIHASSLSFRVLFASTGYEVVAHNPPSSGHRAKHAGILRKLYAERRYKTETSKGASGYADVHSKSTGYFVRVGDERERVFCSLLPT